MVVVTNSTSCVGCTQFQLGTANCRLCLRELRVLTQQDSPSMVLVVFNKYLQPRLSRLIQIPRFNTSNTNSLPPRTSRLPWRMGSRRLFFPPLPLRRKPTPAPSSHPSQIHPRLRDRRILLPKVHVSRLHIANQLCQNRRSKMA